MTYKINLFAATSAAFAAAVAVAVAAPNAATIDPSPVRVAVLADRTATQTDITTAARRARTEATRLTVRRVGGGPEARAAVATLRAEGYQVISAAGPEARAAVAETNVAGLAPAK